MKKLIFATPSCTQLADATLLLLRSSDDPHFAQATNGRCEISAFKDHERRFLFDPHQIKDADVTIIGSTHSDQATMDLFFMASSLAEFDARKLQILVPYYGYSTQERDSDPPGESVTGRYMALLLNAIPTAIEGNRFVFFDIHADAILGFFTRDRRRAYHQYCEDLVLKMIREIGIDDHTVLGCTDSGRMKWVHNFAAKLHLADAKALKVRLGADKTEADGMVGDVQGKSVIIYDDMIRTGGSSEAAARQFLAAGATTIDLVATHGVLPEGSVARLRSSGFFRSVRVLDTHPSARQQADHASGFLHVYSTAPLLAEAICTK